MDQWKIACFVWNAQRKARFLRCFGADRAAMPYPAGDMRGQERAGLPHRAEKSLDFLPHICILKFGIWMRYNDTGGDYIAKDREAEGGQTEIGKI